MTIRRLSIIATLFALILTLGACSRYGTVETPTGPSTVTPKVYMDPATVNTLKDNPFTLQIYIENVTNLYYAAFYVVYDPAKVSYMSGTAGDFLKQGNVNVTFMDASSSSMPETAIGNGLVKRPFGMVRMDNSKGGVSGSGVLCSITFKAKSTGTAGISFSTDPNDQGFMDVNNKTIQITVGSGSNVNIL